MCSTRVGSSLTCKYYIRLERFSWDKWSSLFCFVVKERFNNIWLQATPWMSCSLSFEGWIFDSFLLLNHIYPPRLNGSFKPGAKHLKKRYEPRLFSELYSFRAMFAIPKEYRFQKEWVNLVQNCSRDLVLEWPKRMIDWTYNVSTIMGKHELTGQSL